MAINQLYSRGFPDAYYNLIAAYTGTIVYVSPTGSNSNNGSSVNSPYLTIDYALSNNSAVTRLMIVVLAGTYTMTAVTNGNSIALYDGGKERVFVCCPINTIIQWTANTGDRDAPMVQFTNSASAMYGAICKRNNNGRTTNYTVAFWKGIALGTFNACVFSETNANNAWSYQYDNYAQNNIKLYNCTFYNGAAPAANYTNAGTCLTQDSVFNTTVTTGGTENNVLKSQTVNATTYVTTGVTTAGVYSGTYAWNGTATPPNGVFPFSDAALQNQITTSNEGANVYWYYNTLTTSTTVTYTITGTSITSSRIGIPLTGNMTVTNTTGTVLMPILADNAIEGTSILYFSVGPFTSPLTIYDTSAPLTVIPPTGAYGTQYVITLNTASANGTAYNYNITGTNISVATIGSQITGTFIINNNSATFTLLSSSVAGSTFYVNVPALGLQNSGIITYTSSTNLANTATILQMTSTSTFYSASTTPVPGQFAQLNPLPTTTSTFLLTGVTPIPALSVNRITNQNTTTSTFWLTGVTPIPQIMINVSPPQTKITSQSEAGYGNTPVTPLGQPLVKEYWL